MHTTLVMRRLPQLAGLVAGAALVLSIVTLADLSTNDINVSSVLGLVEWFPDGRSLLVYPGGN
jgi:hypothetical protein